MSASTHALAEPAPPRVANVEEFWTTPPPIPSARLLFWEDKIKGGWRQNKRVLALGYYESAEFYGVYIWEYIKVISPLLRDLQSRTP